MTLNPKLDAKHFRLADLIPLYEVLPDGKTVWSKREGKVGLTQVVELGGVDYRGRKVEEVEKLFRIRKETFGNLTDLEFTVHCQRRRREFKGKPENHNSKYVDEIISLHNSQFKEVFTTEIFLVISVEIGSLMGSLVSRLTSTNEEAIAKLNQRVKDLSNRVGEVCKQLEDFSPEILHHSVDESPLLSFWGYVVNGGVEFVPPKQSKYLGNILSVSDIALPAKKPVVEYEDVDSKRYAAFFAINTLPDTTTSAILASLMLVKRKFNLVQKVVTYNEDKMRSTLRKKAGNIDAMNISIMAGRAAEIAEAAERVEASDIKLVGHIFTLCIFGDTEADLEDAINEIKGSLMQEGITLIRERLNRNASYFSQFPQYADVLKSREVLVSTETVADTITFESGQEGLPYSPFGHSPIAYFPTQEGSTYSLNLHPHTADGTLGHTMVIGTAGSGKTMLMSLLLSSCKKFMGLSGNQPMKILGFDRFNGLKIPTLAFGGEYLDASKDDSVSLNPMLLPETEANKTFLEQWLFEHLAGGEGDLSGKVAAEYKIGIKQAVEQIYTLPVEDRSLYSVHLSFGTNRSGSLQEKMQKWYPDAGGLHSKLFNASSDSLSFASQTVVFEMGEILKTKDLAGAFTSYVFKAFENHITNNPSPHICFVDEMPTYLENDAFAREILVAMREWRKRNGVFVGAVQDAEALTKSAHADALLTNTATFILFPNTSASETTYVDRLGLNKEEFAWIKTSNPRREVMVKHRDGASVILNIDLAHLGNYMNLLSSEQNKVHLAESCMKESGEGWIEDYLTKTKGSK